LPDSIANTYPAVFGQLIRLLILPTHALGFLGLSVVEPGQVDHAPNGVFADSRVGVVLHYGVSKGSQPGTLAIIPEG